MSEVFELDTTPGDGLFEFVTDEWFHTLLDECSVLSVELDPDPLEAGPQVLNEKICQCDEILKKMLSHKAKLAKLSRLLADERARVKTDYGVIRDELMVNDPVVHARRSINDREAVVRYRLKNHIMYQSKLDSIGLKLSALDKIFEEKTEQMRSTLNSIGKQLRICQEEIGGLEQRWGSTRKKTRVDLGSGPKVPQPEGSMFGGYEEVQVTEREVNLAARQAILELESKFKTPPDEDTLVEVVVEEVPATPPTLEEFFKETETPETLEDFMSVLEEVPATDSGVSHNEIDFDDILLDL